MSPKPFAESSPLVRALTYLFAGLVGLAPLPVAFLALSNVPLLGVGALVATVSLCGGLLTLVPRLGARGTRHVVYVLFGVALLVVLPLLGIAVDAAADPCNGGRCDPNFRPLSFPGVLGLVPVHAASALAFFVSVRRPGATRPVVEASLVGAMLAGVVLHVLLGVQFVPAVPLAFFVIPLPILTPYLTVPLLLREVVVRLRARGHDALVAKAEARAREASLKEPTYREPAPLEIAPETVVARPLDVPLALRGLGVAQLVVGAHAIVSALVLSRADAAVVAFVETCGYPLSRLPVPPPADCHYLCTIAAQGSPGLVRPFRLGTRRGRTIVVNRQLAVANAFEDLLHERWPRFGRWARKTYDALAVPICGALSRRRWLANALYLAMKPAEVVFELVLLLGDPGDPESRVERMYK